MKEIEDALRQLETDIANLRDALERWDIDSMNNVGAKRYKEKARRLVLQAQQIESLVKENAFPN